MQNGVPNRAEITPNEPDAGNADVGSGLTIFKAALAPLSC